jgi:membrane protein required for colicin V production
VVDNMAEWFGNWNRVDVLMAAVLAVSLLVGLLRGLVLEMMSLAGWFAAWFAARWMAPLWAHWLPVGAPGSAVQHAAAFAIGFLVALVLWGMLGRLLRLLVHATPLRLVDRLLGAVFGGLRGLVLLLAVAVVVVRTPWVHETAWRESTGAHVMQVLMAGLAPWVPRLGVPIAP